MANTHTQINIQSIFAVKGREHIVHESNRDETEKYVTGMIAIANQRVMALYTLRDIE